jgi:plasmid stability protein
MSSITGKITPDKRKRRMAYKAKVYGRGPHAESREALAVALGRERVRFQTDADLDGRIIRGPRRAAHEIDIQTAADAKLERRSDADVLRIAADSGRVLVSQDRRTMPAHFARYAARAQSPGVILLRDATSVAAAIEYLLLIWSASEAEEWIGRLV